VSFRLTYSPVVAHTGLTHASGMGSCGKARSMTHLAPAAAAAKRHQRAAVGVVAID